MFRTIHIRTKLAAALAVPLVALVIVAAVEVDRAAVAADDARAEADLATATIGPGSFLINLQNERNRASIDLIGLGQATTLPVDNNPQARGITDTSLQDLRSQLASQGPEVNSAFAPALGMIDDLAKLRQDIDAYKGPQDLTNSVFANEVFTRYTTIIESFFDSVSTIGLSIDDADLRNGVEIIDASAREGELRARIVRAVVLATLQGTINTPAVRQDIAALNDRTAAYDESIATHAVGPYKGVADQTFHDKGVVAFGNQLSTYLGGGAADITAMLDAVRYSPTTGYTGLRNRASTILEHQADDIVGAAVGRERRFIGIAAGVVLLALVITWLASRSITRPLRALRHEAEDMAEHRLPDALRTISETPLGEDLVIPTVAPVVVNTRDEVRQVAAALNTVQRRALDLAVEQAVLRRNVSDSFVNLGRRNQNLLNRQLDLITELESKPQDAESLDGLFRVDHLATRMRRNAESLLVLSDVEPPRRWTAPVDVADVVRAASGEVEDYQRVVVRHLDGAAIGGSAATDLAHVLAELLENALTFSPPDQPVEVKGRFSAHGYTLGIVDNGIGMSPEEMAEANRRLAGTESPTVAPSRYLGHYVAGHLAARHGIAIQLQDGPVGGVTAKVFVPAALVDEAPTSALVLPALAPAPAPVRSPGWGTEDRPATLAEALWTLGAPADARELTGPEPTVGAPTLAAPTLAAPPPTVETAPTTTAGLTASGLTRRVAGAQRPDVAAPTPFRPNGVVPEPEPTPTRPDPVDLRPSDDDADEVSRPEDVYAFLSSFVSGVDRGRTDGQEEDER
jgi:signal transduction histidine kinase